MEIPVSYYTPGTAATHYTSGAGYNAFGGRSGMTLNSGGVSSWSETWTYNNRLRATSMNWPAVALGYGYDNSGADNGNPVSHSISRGGLNWCQSFSYDNLNRLWTAAETGQASDWSQTYQYDRYGNRWVASTNFPQAAVTPSSLANFDAATNHLQGISGGQGYDLAGNLTQPGSVGMAYDTDGHL